MKPDPMRPGSCPTLDHLSAYVDGVLDDTARAEVQRHLLHCPACRDTVADAARILNETDSRSRRLLTSRFVLPAAIAASALLAVSLWLFARTTDSRINGYTAELVMAVATESTRPVDGLLVGFAYAPPPVHARAEGVRQPAAAVRVAAAKLLALRSRSDNAQQSAAAGIAFLVTGDVDAAIESLEFASRHDADQARYHNDLSAAYLARARLADRSDDWTRALTAADQAIARSPTMPEPLFNRALALEGLQRNAQAAEAWSAFRGIAPSEAQAEAAARERAARARSER